MRDIPSTYEDPRGEDRRCLNFSCVRPPQEIKRRRNKKGTRTGAVWVALLRVRRAARIRAVRSSQYPSRCFQKNCVRQCFFGAIASLRRKRMDGKSGAHYRRFRALSSFMCRHRAAVRRQRTNEIVRRTRRRKRPSRVPAFDVDASQINSHSN